MDVCDSCLWARECVLTVLEGGVSVCENHGGTCQPEGGSFCGCSLSECECDWILCASFEQQVGTWQLSVPLRKHSEQVNYTFFIQRGDLKKNLLLALSSEWSTLEILHSVVLMWTFITGAVWHFMKPSCSLSSAESRVSFLPDFLILGLSGS